jgi:2-polyprenyl-6-methoxyphenol hydroxylase-like FAD-dependent oxidoreductase
MSTQLPGSSSSSSSSDVLVVGAGPTGLTLACLLRARGIDVRIVDRLPAPVDVTKAMVIWSRSLEVLDEIGVAGTVEAAGIALERARYIVDAKVAAEVRTSFVPGTSRQPVILTQNELERILRERLVALGGQIEWDTQVEEVAEVGDGLRASAMRGGRLVALRAAYVVGCEGLRSAVRESAGIAFEDGAPYEEVFQLGDVELDSQLDRSTAHHFIGRRGVTVAVPLPHGRWRIAGYLDGEDPDGKPDAERLQRLLRECGHSDVTVTATYWTSSFRVVRRLAERFRAGRMLVAGDAAHVHSPAGGQGLNTGMQDTHNLAWKLALVVRGAARDELLDSYEAERRPVAQRILRMTQMQDQYLFGARSVLVRAIRNGALRMLDSTGLMESQVIPDLAQVRLDYKASPLTGGSRSRRALYRPGPQLPDVCVVPEGESEPVALRARAAGAGITLVAIPGPKSAPEDGALETLAERFGSGAVQIVRPSVALPGDGRGYVLGVRADGYVAYRGKCAAVSSLEAWLRDAVGLVEVAEVEDEPPAVVPAAKDAEPALV